MATRKFRFVSPGVFLKEIDLSQLPGQAPGVGPVLIGRTRQGPSMKPYKVKSWDEFTRVFGLPMPGNEGSDPWRDGTDLLGESYLPYAAKAYLSADIDSPVTIVRLAGISGTEADPTAAASEAGWEAKNAWALFVMPYSASLSITGSTPWQTHQMDLAAVFYGESDDFQVRLKGVNTSGSAGDWIEVGAGQPVHFSEGTNRLTVSLKDGALTKDVTTTLSEMREEFNTNPVMTNTDIASPASATLAGKYWLGETFEETFSKLEAQMAGADSKRTAVVFKLKDGMEDFSGPKHQLHAARSGWVVSQDTSRDSGSFDPTNQSKLFRIQALHEGSEASRNLMIGIESIKVPRDGDLNAYGSFSVVVRKIQYGTGKLEEIERFDNCDLNPESDNYLPRAIGDQYYEWSENEQRNKHLKASPMPPAALPVAG